MIASSEWWMIAPARASRQLGDLRGHGLNLHHNWHHNYNINIYHNRHIDFDHSWVTLSGGITVDGHTLTIAEIPPIAGQLGLSDLHRDIECLR
jgi:hypothetical protein